MRQQFGTRSLSRKLPGGPHGFLVVLLSIAWCGSAVLAQDNPDAPKKRKAKVEELPELPKPVPPKLDPIPKIPTAALPKKTRAAPDVKRQYLKGRVYVGISSRITPRSGKPRASEVPVVREYVSEYFRRAGYQVVAKPGDADFRVEGRVESVFENELIFRERVLAWKYFGAAELRVFDRAGKKLESISTEDISVDGGKDETTTTVDLRRRIAKDLHDRIFLRGKTFSHPKAAALLAALLEDPLEAKNPMTGERIVLELGDIGLPAVPCLLEALTDKHTVLAEMSYPGLTNLEMLKVYHVADQALEEIFQKVSRMDLKTGTRHRYIMIRGWENEWRRFCPSFRESPQYKARLAAEKAKREMRERQKKAAAGTSDKARQGTATGKPGSSG